MTDLLYLTHRVPCPPNRGDRIRTHHVLRYLSQRYRVHLACLADEPTTSETLAELQRLCRSVAIVPVGRRSRWVRGLASFVRGRTVTAGLFASSSLGRVVRNWCRDVRFSAALASSSALSRYLQQAWNAGVPAVMDFIDVDSRKWADYADASRGPRAWLYRQEAARLQRVEQDVCRWVSGAAVVSEAEADLLREFCPLANVQAIANGVDVDYFAPRGSVEQSGCVFIGAMDYRPNVDGCVWFCRHVWPAIILRHPKARFRIVGRAPTAAVRELGRLPGVEVVGTVSDVRPYLNQAAVSIAPLAIARGVQNKVLESLAAGKAVIAAPASVVGLGVRPGEHLLQADTPAEWVNCLTRLFDDPALRHDLGTAGQAFVTMYHRWESCLHPLGDLLFEAARSRRFPRIPLGEFET